MSSNNSIRHKDVTPSSNGSLIFSRLLVAIILLLVSSACGSQAEGDRESDDLIATAVAATVSAQPTETLEAGSVSVETPAEVQDVVKAVAEISDPHSYPEAEELDNVDLDWDLLTPPCFSLSVEDVITHRAWRSEDLPEKIINYYDEMAYEENWEPDSRYISCDGPWQYRSFRRGDDFMGLAVLGNLPSAYIA